MPFAPRFTISNTITDALTRIERARGFLDAAKLSDEWLGKMQDQALVREAHHTTHIEGTQLTLEEAELILHGQHLPDADPDDAREVLNYREAFDLVAGYIGAGEAITEVLIREIHRRLVRGVRGDSAAPGEYRRIQNYVVNSRSGQVIYTPPPAHEIPILMSELVTWLNAESSTHAVLIAGITQFQLVEIHPFLDGNGRTARLLATLCLYRHGYDFKRLFAISEYYDRDRSAYYRAIQATREKDYDLTGWLEYFTDGLAIQLREVQSRGEQAIRVDLVLSRARKAGLKERALSVLAFILASKRGTMAELEKELGENRRSLQRDVRLLLEMGLIREVASDPKDPTKYYEPQL